MFSCLQILEAFLWFVLITLLNVTLIILTLSVSRLLNLLLRLVAFLLFLNPIAAEGRKANDSHADCYQYFCVPEYGTANGRLHFHAVHFMRTLPTGSVDPNFGRRVRNRRQ